jgi:Fe-S-cluster containining protein
MAERSPEQSAEVGEARINAFSAEVLPAEWKELRELPRRIQTANARAASKLKQIYAVADKVFGHAGAHAACAKGCGHCCHLTVPITAAEARVIGERIGVAPATLKNPQPRDPLAWRASPCTFLVDNACSIYEARPLECRSTFNFDLDSYWCREENWEKPGASVPKATFEEFHAAYRSVTPQEEWAVADIRDYFPKGLRKG